MSNGKIFSENQYYFLQYCFLKIIFKKNCPIICSEITFSTDPFHIETNQLIALQTNWPVSIWYDFLLKGVPQQTLIAATVIDFIIILVLYELNSRNQRYELFNIMEYKNISSKFTLQTQRKTEYWGQSDDHIIRGNFWFSNKN